MIKYKNVNWKIYQGVLIPDLAPHIEINLSNEDQKELLKKSNAYFIRWITEWDRKNGEFWYIIKDEKEDLFQYKSKIRSQIKRGLKNCKVEPVDKKTIANYGYQVYIEAFKRYKTFQKPVEEKEFINSILKSDSEFWGVYLKNKLIAYAQNILQNNMCHYSTVKLHPDFLQYYPSYALFFEMNRYYLNEKNLLYVSDGARSISHQTNIQKFLIQKFRFRKAYCKLNIAYRNDIKILVNILYPFRGIFSKFHKINILLKHEQIRRSFEKLNIIQNIG